MSINQQYETARKELLDLGLRNSLLNFRHSSARGVRVQGESSAEVFRLLATEEKAMTFVPRKGLEVDLSPHLDNARRRLEDLPRWPKQIDDPAQLAELLQSLTEPVGKVAHSLTLLPKRVEAAIDNAATDENEAAGRLLLEEVMLAIQQAERVRDRVARGREILKGSLETNQANYISKSLEREIDILAGEHLARVEDAATGGALRKEWLKPLTEKELRDTKLQTNDTDRPLQKRLLATYHAARTYIEERGHNVLFLALGMLHWHEDEDPKRDLKAPLLLLPVKLERAAVRERYKLSFTGDDIEENLSLAEKLRIDFALDPPAFPMLEDLDPKAYFAAVREKVSGRKNWTVEDDEIYLGFFSFTKLMMYRDLDCACWPKDEQPLDHSLLRAVLAEGFNEPGSPYDDETLLDDHHSPHDSHEVMNADGSQLMSILDVRDGRNIVIQGPPGTGKSQTITNLVAQALGQGKRVLFVAEKMAALEVVKRRLDLVGLGDACLEVHSHNANKKAMINELKRTLNQGRVVETKNAASDLDLLARLRHKLNEYAQAVNAPLAQTGYSAYEIFGELIHQQRQLKGITGLPRPESMMDALRDLDIVLNCSRADLEERTVAVNRLREHLGVMGRPVDHPYHGVGLTRLLPTGRDQLFLELPKALETEHGQVRHVAALREALGFGAQANWVDARRLGDMASRAAEAPDLRGINLRTGLWEDEEVALDELMKAGGRFGQLHADHAETLIPEAWGRDVLVSRAALVEHGEKWYRFFSGDYRRARAEVRALCRAGQAPKAPAALLQLCEAIMEEKRLRKAIEARDELGAATFGKKWRGPDSDWPKLVAVCAFTTTQRADVRAGTVAAELLNYLESDPDTLALLGLVTAMENAHAACCEQLGRVFDLLEFEANEREAFLTVWDFDRQAGALEAMMAQPERLDEQIFFNQLAEELRSSGLGWVLDGAAEWDQAAAHLGHWFRNAWFERLLEVLLDDREPLRRFNHAAHAEDIGRFRGLDDLLFLFNRIKLAARHWEGLPPMVGSGQLGILMREFEKRARHLPIRRLMTETGRAMQAIKPVFMMSPMSVASFLPPSSVKFDLVIFDEASQVKPVDALGAILRGKQLVVVGDSKQMPPTRFFDSIGGDENRDEDDLMGDLESILGTMTGQRAPQRMLRWHYRSRHESLIAVSNQEFYDGKLVIFPNPNPADPTLGIKYHHLPDTVYERGGSSANPLEARAVARAVFRHARECPDLTLGVAAFSVKQMQAVLDEVERLRMEDNSQEDFFGAHPHEPFFVKNLENVQGDERDVIYISVGYGRDEEGKVSMNFGPLNNDGGERRLNVLITRARRRCEVFTNLRALDIDLGRTSARGVEVFKAYLQYAETGGLKEETRSAAGVSTVLEEEVAAFLRGHGHGVRLKVGEAGFFIDLAVEAPGTPGTYLLGIECDGPEYNRARTARDRDRLRQQVLEGLGWRVYRLWSVEWFAHPAQEQERLLAALRAAQDGQSLVADGITEEADQLRKKRVEELRTVRREPTSAKLTGTLSQPKYKIATPRIQLGKKELIDQSDDKLAGWVTEIVRVESPVHFYDVYARFLAATGKRQGERNRQAVAKGIVRARAAGAIRDEGDFIFDTAQTAVQVRDRRSLAAKDRRFDYVADAELDAAILLGVRQSFGIEPEDISISASRLLGFDRTLEPMRQRVDGRVDVLMGEGRLVKRNRQIQVPD